jgi:hypothetical protein
MNKEGYMTCEGSCEEHVGDVVDVWVTSINFNNGLPWHFTYCQEAIAEDRRRGFTVDLKNPLIPNEEG